ncbi:MAG: hypothetical protein U1F09_13045 [Steroidobacteraceae bacterium]
MTTPDPIRQRAQEVAEAELAASEGLHHLRTEHLAALRRAYLQGRVDRSEELLRAVNSARNDVEIESAATAARSVA